MSYSFNEHFEDGSTEYHQVPSRPPEDSTPYEPSFLPDNTAEAGPLFYFHGPGLAHRVGVRWIREVADPWRRGYGAGIRVGDTTHMVGVWFRGKPAARDLADPFSSISPADLVKNG